MSDSSKKVYTKVAVSPFKDRKKKVKPIKQDRDEVLKRKKTAKLTGKFPKSPLNKSGEMMKSSSPTSSSGNNSGLTLSTGPSGTIIPQRGGVGRSVLGNTNTTLNAQKVGTSPFSSLAQNNVQSPARVLPNHFSSVFGGSNNTSSTGPTATTSNGVTSLSNNDNNNWMNTWNRNAYMGGMNNTATPKPSSDNNNAQTELTKELIKLFKEQNDNTKKQIEAFQKQREEDQAGTAFKGDSPANNNWNFKRFINQAYTEKPGQNRQHEMYNTFDELLRSEESKKDFVDSYESVKQLASIKGVEGTSLPKIDSKDNPWTMIVENKGLTQAIDKFNDYSRLCDTWLEKNPVPDKSNAAASRNRERVTNARDLLDDVIDALTKGSAEQTRRSDIRNRIQSNVSTEQEVLTTFKRAPQKAFQMLAQALAKLTEQLHTLRSINASPELIERTTNELESLTNLEKELREKDWGRSQEEREEKVNKKFSNVLNKVDMSTIPSTMYQGTSFEEKADQAKGSDKDRKALREIEKYSKQLNAFDSYANEFIDSIDKDLAEGKKQPLEIIQQASNAIKSIKDYGMRHKNPVPDSVKPEFDKRILEHTESLQDLIKTALEMYPKEYMESRKGDLKNPSNETIKEVQEHLVTMWDNIADYLPSQGQETLYVKSFIDGVTPHSPQVSRGLLTMLMQRYSSNYKGMKEQNEKNAKYRKLQNGTFAKIFNIKDFWNLWNEKSYIEEGQEYLPELPKDQDDALFVVHLRGFIKNVMKSEQARDQYLADLREDQQTKTSDKNDKSKTNWPAAEIELYKKEKYQKYIDGLHKAIAEENYGSLTQAAVGLFGTSEANDVVYQAFVEYVAFPQMCKGFFGDSTPMSIKSMLNEININKYGMGDSIFHGALLRFAKDLTDDFANIKVGEESARKGLIGTVQQINERLNKIAEFQKSFVSKTYSPDKDWDEYTKLEDEKNALNKKLQEVQNNLDTEPQEQQRWDKFYRDLDWVMNGKDRMEDTTWSEGFQATYQHENMGEFTGMLLANFVNLNLIMNNKAKNIMLQNVPLFRKDDTLAETKNHYEFLQLAKGIFDPKTCTDETLTKMTNLATINNADRKELYEKLYDFEMGRYGKAVDVNEKAKKEGGAPPEVPKPKVPPSEVPKKEEKPPEPAAEEEPEHKEEEEKKEEEKPPEGDDEEKKDDGAADEHKEEEEKKDEESPKDP